VRPWNDKEPEDKTHPWEKVPAPEQDSPDYKLLLEPKETNADEITEDRTSQTDCTIRQRYSCLADALKLLSNQMSPRDALIFIGRFYYRLKLKDMEDIFRLDSSNIWRVVKRTERSLQKRDDSN